MTDDPFEPFSKHHPVVPEPAAFGVLLLAFVLTLYYPQRPWERPWLNSKGEDQSHHENLT